MAARKRAGTSVADYERDMKILNEYVSTYLTARDKFYKAYDKNIDNPKLIEFAADANLALDNARDATTRVHREIRRNTPGYPKYPIQETAKKFYDLDEKVNKLLIERKGQRKRKTFKSEGKKRIRDVESGYRQERAELRVKAQRALNALRRKPGLELWRPAGAKERFLYHKDTARAVLDARKNRRVKKREIRKTFGLGLRLGSKMHARRIRKMKP